MLDKATLRLEVYDIIIHSLVEWLGLDRSKVVEHALLGADLGLDSLDLIELLLEHEDLLGVVLEDNIITTKMTVGQAVEVITLAILKQE